MSVPKQFHDLPENLHSGVVEIGNQPTPTAQPHEPLDSTQQWQAVMQGDKFIQESPTPARVEQLIQPSIEDYQRADDTVGDVDQAGLPPLVITADDLARFYNGPDPIVGELQCRERQLHAEIAAHKATRERLYDKLQEVAKQMNEQEAELMSRVRTAEADNQELRRKVEELETALNSSKLPKMFVWHGRGKWVAMAHAFSVAEARELLLEETGTTDGSCPVRAQALEEIRSENPTIFYSSNAEFHLTDSGELEEADAYSETLKLRAQKAEAELATMREEREKMFAVVRGHAPQILALLTAKEGQ